MEATHRRVDWLHALVLVALVALGLAARLAYLDQPMRYDESMTYYRFASKGVAHALRDYGAPNNHLFHTLLVMGATRLLGPEPEIVRGPALLAGIALVPLTYACLAPVFSAPAALLAAALVAGSSYLTFFSTNARGYTLLCAIFLLLVPRARALAARPAAGNALAFAALATLGLFTVPVLLYGVVGLGLWVLWLAARGAAGPRPGAVVRALALAAAVTAGATVLLYLPAVLGSGLDALISNTHVRPRGLESTLRKLPAFAGGLAERAVWDWPRPAAALLAAAGVAGLLRLARERREAFALVAANALAILGVIVAMRAVRYERACVYELPLAFAVAGAGLAWGMERGSVRPALRRGSVAAVALLLGAAGAWWTARGDAVRLAEETGTFPDAEAVLLDYTAEWREGDYLVLITPMPAPVRYYAARHGLRPRLYHESFADRAQRLFVVVAEPPFERNSLERTLEIFAVERAAYTEPVPLRRYPYATLYRMERRGGTSPRSSTSSTIGATKRRPPRAEKWQMSLK